MVEGLSLSVGQVGEDLIAPDSVDSLRSAAPGAGLFKPVDFCFQVGPIFNFVSGKTSLTHLETYPFYGTTSG